MQHLRCEVTRLIRMGSPEPGTVLAPGAAAESKVAVATLAPLLNLLGEVPDPRRAQGQLYTLPRVLVLSILAIVTGVCTRRGPPTGIDDVPING